MSNPYGPLIDERKLFYMYMVYRDFEDINNLKYEIKFVSLNTIHKYII